MSSGVFLGALAFWLASWTANVWLSRHLARIARWASPILFGAAILALWEGAARGFAIPMVVLPAPSQIVSAFAANTDKLWADFVQTVLRAVLPGFAMGCGAAFLTALAIDRSPFLRAGLLPYATLFAALPIVGLAPIMVMWFGFDWHSKAAVAAIMSFFPILLNTVAGLDSADRMQRDLMRTYAASYGQTLVKLRIPAAGPFIFNGLKIGSTLAVIGAIVAEFFGSPTVGIGFRINTEVGRLAIDFVWASITVAAMAGLAFYGLLAAIERAVTFWHPSVRG